MMNTNDQNQEGEFYGDSELRTAENLMYRDAPLTPKMISSLMHVDVSLTNTSVHQLLKEEKQRTHSLGYILGVLVLSCIIAASVGTSLMFFHELGPFSETSQVSPARP